LSCPKLETRCWSPLSTDVHSVPISSGLCERPRWTFRRLGTAIRTLATRRREAELLPGRGVKLPCLSARSQSLVDVAFGSI
jgi:hypothetical protein